MDRTAHITTIQVRVKYANLQVMCSYVYEPDAIEVLIEPSQNSIPNTSRPSRPSNVTRQSASLTQNVSHLTRLCCQKPPDRLNPGISLLQMRTMTALRKSDPLDFAGYLAKEGLHGNILRLVEATVDEQHRNGYLMEGRSNVPCFERARDEELRRTVPV